MLFITMTFEICLDKGHADKHRLQTKYLETSNLHISYLTHQHAIVKGYVDEQQLTYYLETLNLNILSHTSTCNGQQ